VIEVQQGETVRVTVSIGIAAFDSADTEFADVVQRMSDALRNAKRTSRNRLAAQVWTLAMGLYRGLDCGGPHQGRRLQ